MLMGWRCCGIIDVGVLSNVGDESVRELIEFVKAKNFTSMRKWVGQNLDSDPVALMRKIYDEANSFVKPEAIPSMVLSIAEYQYKAAFVADQEVNLVACLTTLMAECDFK